MNGQNGSNRDMPKSSTGLDENIAGFICYLGSIVTGLIFFLLEKDSRFVKFHAMQSVVFFAMLFIVRGAFGYVPLIGWVIKLLLSLVGLALWLVLMVSAYHHERLRLPVVSEIADNLVKAFDKSNTRPNA